MALAIRLEARLDRLADPLIDLLAQGGGAPLAQDVVIVPSLGVARWLQQRAAQRLGVSAGWHPDFAGRYLWRLLAELFPDLPSRSPFEPARSRWSLMALLAQLPEAAELAPLRQRLAQANPADRFELASDLAAHFDRYLAYRRDWLDAWQAGRSARDDPSLTEHEGWQAWLWRALLARLPGVSAQHPIDRFERALAADPDGLRRRLAGRRVMLLGALPLSPEQFRLFGELSRLLDVHVFAPDPCREFWQDMLSPQARARVEVLSPAQAWMYEGQPRVLGAWGRAQRDFGVQVMELAESAGVQIEEPLRDQSHAFADPGAPVPAQPDCLQALQLAVFLASDEPWRAVRGPDPSLRILATHGVMRSAEVLHDTLLACFDDDPSLRPHDVAVFCADIDACAAPIESVFGAAPAGRRIALSMSGRSANADPLLRALVELFTLVRQRLPLPAVAQWLENPVFAHTLGWDDDSRGRLIELFTAAGARWGIDPAQGPAKHSWRDAFDRLLLGAAFGAHGARIGDRFAVPGVRAGQAEPLGPWPRLAGVFERLSAACAQDRSVGDWCALATWAAEQLLAGRHPWESSLQRLNDALVILREGSEHESALPLDVSAFSLALTQALQDSVQAAFPGPAVTVCPLGGLRGVPFKVVVLFGMDESAWPRAGLRGEFDLIAHRPRFGDRLARTDDRGVFLDALLACQDRAVILFQGKDARDDARLNPSPVVAELVEYLHAMRPEVEPSAWVEQQPVHGFSRASYVGERASYDADWLEAARSLATPLDRRQAAVGPFDPPKPALSKTDDPPASSPVPIDLDRMARDLADPIQLWWRERFGLKLPFEPAPLSEFESLGEPLEREAPWVGDLAWRLLCGERAESLLSDTAARPELAQGPAADYQAGLLLDSARRLLAPLDALAQPDADPAALPDKPGAAMVEARVLQRLVQAGRPATLSALDEGQPLSRASLLFPELGLQVVIGAYPVSARLLIQACLAHALWCLADANDRREAADRAPGRTIALGREAVVVVDFAPDDARSILREILRWRRRCARDPLPLFPEALRKAFLKSGDDAQRREFEAVVCGDDQGWRAGELAKPWAKAFYRDGEPDLRQAFDLSAAVFGPLFERCEVIGGKG